MTLVDATNTPDQSTAPESRDSELTLAKAPREPSFFEGLLAYIKFWFAIPRYLIQLKQDQDALSTLFLEKMRQDNELAKQLRDLSRRLAYYEQHIPRMRELRQHYKQEQMGIRKSAQESGLIALG